MGDGSAGRAKTTVRNGMAPKRHSGCSTGDAGTTARLAARRCGAAQSQRDERLPHARTHLRLLALGTRGLTHMPLLFDVRFNAEATVEHKGSAPSSKHGRRSLAAKGRTAHSSAGNAAFRKLRWFAGRADGRPGTAVQ